MQEERGVVSSRFTFRGVDYIVGMWVNDDNLLTVEVEDRLTADQWRGSFEPAYIEDLTHKTGNYKQYSIFLSMLESALLQNSESVSLDLLTYADLESLRNRKAGLGTRAIPGGQRSALNTKRYLIVTYTVEFDRIHYPLPLPYQGKPDPVALQDTVRELRKEVKLLESHVGQKLFKLGLIYSIAHQDTKLHSDRKSSELVKLTKDYENLLLEKQEIEDAFLRYRREVKNTATGSAAKEVRILKTAIQNLEEELGNERRKYQRSSSKRSQNYRELLEEVEELRASERNLKVRVKSLTNELSILRRNPSRRSTRSPMVPTPVSQRQSRPAARRPPSADIARSRPRSRVETSSRERSLSRGRRSSLSSVGSRNRSVSPAGARAPRFDPTAYTLEKKRREEESKLKSARLQNSGVRSGGKSRLTSSGERGRTRKRLSDGYRGFRSRSSSAGSVGSRRSSAGGVSDVEVLSDASEGRRRRLREVMKPGKTSSSKAWASPNVPFRRKTGGAPKRLMSTPDPDYTSRRGSGGKTRSRPLSEYNGQDRSAALYSEANEMSEIDARLSALQHFMKHNL
ncbi:coiled-coil domain-containing protein 61 [Strongylocentrotus purpuratus]|uniref:Centrosomal protein CCDC61 n=1 Tax=Strongylocentrotus purpuratus TaxID=7668 RepID=A0A7M7PTW1_STRPU|nr:coiled-coil domain-containing protein 61 [Strongylocentrotus purpuratus]